MKKILCLLFVLCSSVVLYAIDLDDKYLSQSGELMFRFCADSLYIDIAQSHRNVSAFKLVKNKEDEKSTTYDAFETYLDHGRQTYRQVLIRVIQEENESYLLEYFGKDKDRDYNSNERYHIKMVE